MKPLNPPDLANRIFTRNICISEIVLKFLWNLGNILVLEILLNIIVNFILETYLFNVSKLNS